MADYLVNTSDPAATSLPLRDGVRMGYQAHDVVDGGPARIILTALVAPAEVADDAPALDVLWHARFRWRLRPQYAVADKGYATVAIIRRRDEQGLRADLSLPTSLAVVNQMPQCRSWLALAGRHGNNVGHV